MSPDDESIAILEQMEAHQARNQELVAVIVARGGLLQTRRRVDLHFWSKSEQDAEMLVEALRRLGVQAVRANPPPGMDRIWSVEASLETTVEDVTREAYVESLVRLAIQHGSEFDGWGTEL